MVHSTRSSQQALLPRLGASRCSVCPFQPAAFPSHGNHLLEGWWSVCKHQCLITTQSWIMLFLFRIWEVFPTTAVQTKPPAATGSGTEAPHRCMCSQGGFPLIYPTLSQCLCQSCQGKHSKHTQAHPHIHTSKYLSCLIFMNISLNETSVQETFTERQQMQS